MQRQFPRQFIMSVLRENYKLKIQAMQYPPEFLNENEMEFYETYCGTFWQYARSDLKETCFRKMFRFPNCDFKWDINW